MTLSDIVNGLFEFGGGMFVANHCRVLLKDKRVRGVSVLSTAFFSVWGLWNIYYYRHLAQFVSWLAGIIVLVANLTWVGLMLYYKKHPGGRFQLEDEEGFE